MDLYAFSEADKRLMSAIIERVQRTLGNTRPQTPPPEDRTQTPEAYIALTPSEGIDALVDSGTADFPTPGWADCEIWRIRQEGEEYTVEPAPADLNRQVFNLSESPIKGGTYIMVTREKLGCYWVALTGGGGESGHWARLTSRALVSGKWVYGHEEIEYPTLNGSLAVKEGGTVGYAPPSLTVTVVTQGTASAAEVQTVLVSGPVFTSGDWELGGATGLAYNIDAATLETALEASLGVGLTVTGNMSSGFTITWVANGPRETLTGSISGLVPSAGANYAHEANAWARARIGAVVWMRPRSGLGDYQFGLTMDACSFDAIPGYNRFATINGTLNVLVVDADGCLAIHTPAECSPGTGSNYS